MPTQTVDPLPDLIRTLRSRAITERIRAARDLGRLGALARDALSTLVGLLRDEDAKVREAAAQAVGQMGSAALPALSGMLAHSDKYVRRHAIWAIGKLGPHAKATLPTLCRSLKDADPRTASGAAQAIGSMGPAAAEAIPALTEAMRGTNIVLCRLAGKALSQIGTPAVPQLIAHLQHTDPFVRGEAALAVGWIGSSARSAIPYLAQLVRGKKTRTLRDTPAPCGSLERFAKSEKPDAGSGTLTPLANSASSCESPTPEETCRVYSAQALGRMGVEAAEAVADLRIAERTGTDALRQAAQQAIRLIQGD